MRSKNRMEKTVDLRRRGCTYQEIADQLGITRQAAHQIVKVHAPELVKPGETEIRIVELRRAGKSFDDIASEVGVRRGRVSEILKRVNPPPAAILPADICLTEEQLDSNPQLRPLMERGKPVRVRKVAERSMILQELARKGLTQA
jgi:DNA-binding CsgD family transcriptional regulator